MIGSASVLSLPLLSEAKWPQLLTIICLQPSLVQRAKVCSCATRAPGSQLQGRDQEPHLGARRLLNLVAKRRWQTRADDSAASACLATSQQK